MVRSLALIRLVEILFRAISTFLFWMFRVVAFTLLLVLTSFVSIWRGVPQSVTNIATEWQQKAHQAGVPTDWDRPLYFVLYGVAFLTILAGWVILSYITIWIVNLIF